jgi:integrase/recombinase XerD
MSKPSSNSPEHQQLMDPGALRSHIQAFTADLTALGHTRLTVSNYSDCARHFADWLNQSEVALSDVDAGVVEQFVSHRCHCPGNRHHDHLSARYVSRVRRFVRFLADSGVVPATELPATKAIDERVTEFQDWLRRHRGIRERTIDRHGRMVMRLLPALGRDPAAYDAGLVRRVIVEEARTCSRAYTKTMATALRGYLRFLAARGACRPWLDQAVPTMPHWRLSALPRYLPTADVERLIASCDLTKPHGIRDRAILLLLARLGLRAGDVLDMRLDDIVWEEGTLRVRGKGRREIRLPLLQDVGDALLDYLDRVRPIVECDRIFLRSKAPYRPFAGSWSISDIVRLALKRADITTAPSQGANLLRHSAATGMLRAGATLDAIGAVLRHRSADTTAHYAKVDILMRRQVTQPWPGETSC